MSLASSIAIRYLKHGIGPNISCPTDSFVIQTAVDAFGFGIGRGAVEEVGGGVREGGLASDVRSD